MKPLGGSTPSAAAHTAAHAHERAQPQESVAVFAGLQFREPAPKPPASWVPSGPSTSLRARPVPTAASAEPASAGTSRAGARDALDTTSSTTASSAAGAADAPGSLPATAVRSQGQDGRDDRRDDDESDGDGETRHGHEHEHGDAGPTAAQPGRQAPVIRTPQRPPLAAEWRAAPPRTQGATPAALQMPRSAQRPAIEFMGTQLALLSKSIPGSNVLWGANAKGRRAAERELALASMLLWNADRAEAPQQPATPSQVNRAALHAYLSAEPRAGVLDTLAAVQDALVALRPGPAVAEPSEKQRVHYALLPLVLLHAHRPRSAEARAASRARLQFVEASTRKTSA